MTHEFRSIGRTRFLLLAVLVQLISLVSAAAGRDLAGKTMLVTGASSGLGKALSLMAAAQGAKLILLSNEEEPLEGVRSLIRERGGTAEGVVCDIRDLPQVRQAIGQISKAHPQIDIVVNNAGVWTDDELEKTRPELRRNALEVNALGNIQFCETILPLLKKQRRAHVLNVVSTAAVPDLKDGDNTRWKSYGASKWAFAGYTQALAASLARTSIKVTAFFPGGFESRLYERVGRPNAHHQPWMMRVEDVAEVALFALTRPDDVQVSKIVVTKIQ